MGKYGFIYIWYDRKRKMYYIGCHWGTEDDGYICSSDRMRKAYRRRPQDFKRRVIARVNERNTLLTEEYKWLQLIPDEELGKKYYNLNKNHFGHWSTDPNASKTTKEKLSEKAKMLHEDPVYREKYLKGLKNRPPPTEKTKQKMSKSQTGKKRSEEARRKASESLSGENHYMYGKTVPEKTKKKISESLSGEKNPFYGKKHPPELMAQIAEKISKKLKGRMPKYIPSQKGELWWNDGKINKKSKECPGEGWVRGMIKKPKSTGV